MKFVITPKGRVCISRHCLFYNQFQVFKHLERSVTDSLSLSLSLKSFNRNIFTDIPKHVSAFETGNHYLGQNVKLEVLYFHPRLIVLIDIYM